MKFKGANKALPSSRKGLESLLNKAANRSKHWLDLIILDTLQKGQSTKIRKTDKYFNPSFCGDEPRLVYLSLTGQNVRGMEFSDSSLDRMEHGNYVHMKIYDFFEKARILKVKEIKNRIEVPIPLSVRGDCVIVEKDTGKDYLVEIKSMESGLFSALNVPTIGNLIQWVLTGLALGIDRGCLFYENKNDQKRKVYDVLRRSDGTLIVKRNDLVIETYENFLGRVLNKLNYVNSCYQNNKIPARCKNCTVKCKNHSLCLTLEKQKEILECTLEML